MQKSLLLSKLLKMKGAAVQSTFDPGAMLRMIIDTCKKRPQNGTVKEEVELGLAIRGDKSLLHKLFSIVVENSFEHATDREFVFSLRRSGGFLQATAENATPAKPEFFASFLEPCFFESCWARTKGVGLSLALAHTISVVHGGGLTFLAGSSAGRVLCEISISIGLKN